MIHSAERRNRSAARRWCLASSESAAASPVRCLSSRYQHSASSQLMERGEVRGTRSPRRVNNVSSFCSTPPRLIGRCRQIKCAGAASCLHPVHAWAACRQIFSETRGRGEVEQRYINTRCCVKVTPWALKPFFTVWKSSYLHINGQHSYLLVSRCHCSVLLVTNMSLELK